MKGKQELVSVRKKRVGKKGRTSPTQMYPNEPCPLSDRTLQADIEIVSPGFVQSPGVKDIFVSSSRLKIVELKVSSYTNSEVNDCNSNSS